MTPPRPSQMEGVRFMFQFLPTWGSQRGVVFLLLLLFPISGMAQKISILGDSYSTFEGYMACDTNEI